MLVICHPCGAVTSGETSELAPGSSLVIYSLLLLLLESKYLRKGQEEVVGAVLIALCYRIPIIHTELPVTSLGLRLLGGVWLVGFGLCQGSLLQDSQENPLLGAWLCQGFSSWRKA